MKNNNLAVAIASAAIVIAGYGFLKPANNTSVAEDTLSKVLSQNKITACYATWAPSVVKDPNTGKVSGFVVDAFNEIAEDAQIKVDYVETTWGGFPADLNAKKCDVGVGGFYPLVNRSTAVSFTNPFYFAGNNGVVRAGDNRFKSIQDINQKGVKVAVVQGEFGDIYAKKNLSNAEIISLDKSSDNTAPLVAVSSGQADVGLIMNDTVQAYVAKHPEVKALSSEAYSVTPISWVARKSDQQLLNFLNNAISYLDSSGELDRLAKNAGSDWLTLQKVYTKAGQ